MIHARRRTHLRVMVGLAIGLPLLFVSGLALRPEVPPAASLEGRLAVASGFVAGPVEGWRPVPTKEGAIGFEVARLASAPELVFALRPTTTPLAPDLLVYWVPAGASAPGSGAVLLGGLAGRSARQLALPRGDATASGELIVYSLAHAEVVARLGVDDLVGAGAP